MTKKRFKKVTLREVGKGAWEITRVGVVFGVAAGTNVVMNTVCAAYAPAEVAPMATKLAYKVGSKGVSMAMAGAAARSMDERCNFIENFFTPTKGNKKKSEEKPTGK